MNQAPAADAEWTPCCALHGHPMLAINAEHGLWECPDVRALLHGAGDHDDTNEHEAWSGA